MKGEKERKKTGLNKSVWSNYAWKKRLKRDYWRNKGGNKSLKGNKKGWIKRDKGKNSFVLRP